MTLLIAQGLNNQQIAERLYITDRSVRWYNNTIRNKLGLGNRTQIAIYALQQGWIDLDSITLQPRE